MLLSLIGVSREDKERHAGTEMALAVDELRDPSPVFKKLRRESKSGGKDVDPLAQRRPDYQDVLLDLTFWVWLRDGNDPARPTLAERTMTAIRYPDRIDRSGGLSLGESSFLVDSVSLEKTPAGEALFLCRDPQGFYELPVWVDHGDARKTHLDRFALERLSLSEPAENCWVAITPR